MVTHGTLLTSWTPVLNTGINYGGGTIPLTHTGTNRVYGRVLSASGTLVATRLVYDVGDMVYPAETHRSGSTTAAPSRSSTTARSASTGMPSGPTPGSG